ncbi:MAG: DNA integrity scanning protein DisA nucleotide-binding domain protein [Deltaproteobacteria bacterium]|nr:DNA integrity scanning protein DisA nucleotide-binding domain protein [Deltaproteobacteria bacterium]
MENSSFRHLCLFHTLDGLRDGLSHFSGMSRAAIIYAVRPDDPVYVYDPQHLLHDHEPKFKKLYLESNEWRDKASHISRIMRSGHVHPENNLQLTGLISFGGRSHSIFYQMWFTEHHPDMCSIGPTECWLEHATWLLSHDFATEDPLYAGNSGYVLRNYATHAVRDYIVDQMNIRLGWDSSLRIFPVLDAVLGISNTREEGEWPQGKLIFTEPRMFPEIEFIIRFPVIEQPRLNNLKHVRKLLLAVENSDRNLVSDGKAIVGIATGHVEPFHVAADFRSRHGVLSLNNDPVCSFFDGSFHSSTYRAKLVEVEEILLEAKIDPSIGHELFQIVSRIVHTAENGKYGCTLVIDFNEEPVKISGQKLEPPLDLRQNGFLEFSESLSKVDGALHIGSDLRLHGFACLLDGRATPTEDRARGARFNSALRFTAEHNNLIIIVVSSDRPVSVIQEGIELNAQCEWKPVSRCAASPPLLEKWLSGA